MSPSNIPSAELLESVHYFPGVYQIRAIGATRDDFTSRVLEAVQAEVATPSEVEHAEHFTPDRRHVSVILDITVQTADQVRAIYARIQQVDGLRLLL